MTVEQIQILSEEDVDLTIKLLKSMNESIDQAYSHFKNLKQQLKYAEVSTGDGLGILEVRNHLLLCYLSGLLEVSHAKLSGQRLEGMPVIDHIVEDRVVFERLKPYDKVLKQHIEKIMEVYVASEANQENESEKLNINELIPMGKKSSKNVKKKKSSPSDGKDEEDDRFVAFEVDVAKKLAPKDQEHEEEPSESEEEDNDEEISSNPEKSDNNNSSSEEDKGHFKPIKINPTSYRDAELSHRQRVQAAQQKRAEQQKKRSLRSTLMESLREQFSDAPKEITEGRDLFRLKKDKQRAEQEEYEEETFTRVMMPKAKRMKTKKLATVNSLHKIVNFDTFSPFDQEGEVPGPSSKKRKSLKGKKRKGKKKFKNKKH